MSADRILILAAVYSAAMVLGALGFQYIGGVAPCEMCHWQRWPLYAVAALAALTFALVAAGLVDRKVLPIVAWLALLLIAVTGAIGFWQAGVEWKFFPGPASCTGPRYVVTGNVDLSHVKAVVRCDVVAWDLFGISLAGYNAIFSLGAAALGSLLLGGWIRLPSWLAWLGGKK